MPAAPRAASRGPSMVCGPCRLRRVTMLALVPAASQATRSMATVIASDVFGLTTRMVGLSIGDPPVLYLGVPAPLEYRQRPQPFSSLSPRERAGGEEPHRLWNKAPHPNPLPEGEGT